MASSAPVDLTRAFAARMLPHQFFSHLTAAQILGLPLPRQLDLPSPLHVSSFVRAPRVDGVIGRKARHGSVALIEVEGLRVTSAVDTWCALGPLLSFTSLVIMGDALVRRKNPISTLEELTYAVESRMGQRGHVALTTALGAVRARTDSVRETILRLIIMRAGLPEPLVNFAICDERGEFVAFGDLAYPEYKLLVEYDGSQHRNNEKEFHRDVDRLDDIMQLNWRVVRINKSHIENGQASAKVRRALLAAGWRP